MPKLCQMAGAGLEKIAPNLLLFLVLQECSSDVPTLLPTLNAKISPFDRSLDPDFPHTSGDVSFPSVAASPLYSFELDTAREHTRTATDGGTNDTLTLKGVCHDEME